MFDQELHAHLNGSLTREIIMELMMLADDESLLQEFLDFEQSREIKEISE